MLLFFCNFLLRVGWGRNETLIFIFFLSQPFPTYFGLKWSHTGVFYFFEFFCFFLEFSITCRVRTKRNVNFYFLSFSAFSNLFWLEMKPWRCFLIFWIFWYFFWIFYYASGKDETKRYFLFSHFLTLFQPILVEIKR